MAPALKAALAGGLGARLLRAGLAAPLRFARGVLCLHALWILLSRPDLPDPAFLAARVLGQRGPGLAARFGAGLPVAGEQALFAVLLLALAAAALGLWPRASCAVAGLLLYHFAPQEEILAGIPHTSFGGLTLATLGLLLLAFAETPARGASPSPEFRWPLATDPPGVLVRLLLPGPGQAALFRVRAGSRPRTSRAGSPSTTR